MALEIQGIFFSVMTQFLNNIGVGSGCFEKGNLADGFCLWIPDTFPSQAVRKRDNQPVEKSPVILYNSIIKLNIRA